MSGKPDLRILSGTGDDSPERFACSLLQERGVSDLLSGHRWRLLHVLPLEEWDGERYVCRECEALLYDYNRNAVLRARGPVDGARAIKLDLSYEQPVPSPEEFEAAVEWVAASPVWGNLLRTGAVRPYRPMPPMLEPTRGQVVERTLYVGLSSRPRRFNRIVAVNMLTGEVSRTGVTPTGSLAVEQVCGAEEAACARPRRGTPGSATLQWPASDPVWRMTVVRPSASSGTNGSGVELRDVRFRGRRVLKRAHMPILNVQYAGNACGPFRDWLWAETCFEAEGEDLAGTRGFRVCSTPPRTILESGKDGGNFIGVAIYEAEDGALGLVSQLEAGWYRYIMRWLFYPDGRILPRFGFDGVANSCVCRTHRHHALWRLDFDIIEPANVLEEFTSRGWRLLRRETSRRRTRNLGPRWRVRHPKTGASYQIIPGLEDGTADTFSGDDLHVLRYRGNRELDDGRRPVNPRIQPVSTNLRAFVSGERVDRQDLVVWYGAHFHHQVSEAEEGEHEHHEVGPTLQPFNWPVSQ